MSVKEEDAGFRTLQVAVQRVGAVLALLHRKQPQCVVFKQIKQTSCFPGRSINKLAVFSAPSLAKNGTLKHGVTHVKSRLRKVLKHQD